MSPRVKNVFIGYDNRLCYEGIASLISTHSYNVTGAAENGEEVIKRLQIHTPDIVLIELEYPNKRPIEYLSNIKSGFPEVKIVLISAICNNGNISAVMDTGLSSFILKKCTKEDLFSALDSVSDGKQYFCSVITQCLLNEYHHLKEIDKGLLTNRERQILRRLVNGNSNRMISDELSISESTVKTHRKNLMNKVGAGNLLTLVRYACRTLSRKVCKWNSGWL